MNILRSLFQTFQGEGSKPSNNDGLADVFKKTVTQSEELPRRETLYTETTTNSPKPFVQAKPLSSLGQALLNIEQHEEMVATGNREAEHLLADLYYKLGHQLFNGAGMKKDPVEAFQWFSKAAGRGHCPAQFRLALMYRSEIGTRKSMLQAKNWLNEAANNGFDVAIEYMGYAHETGWLGTIPNRTEAQMWYAKYNAMKMPNCSNPNDAFIYAKQYESSEVPHREFGMMSVKSPLQAFQWYLHAAQLGHLKAMERLGMAYEHGELKLPIDIEKAQSWYKQYNHGLQQQHHRPVRPAITIASHSPTITG